MLLKCASKFIIKPMRVQPDRRIARLSSISNESSVVRTAMAGFLRHPPRPAQLMPKTSVEWCFLWVSMGSGVVYVCGNYREASFASADVNTPYACNYAGAPCNSFSLLGMDAMEPDEQVVFISYTSADREVVTEIVDQLVSRGLTTWIDHRRLKPGQNWDFEIRRALDRSVIIVVFISKHSVKKTGYVQREIRLALEKAEEKLADDIYLIPVLLDDDVVVPSQLRDLQFIRASDDEFIGKLADAVNHQLQKIGVGTREVQNNSEISWSSYRVSERRDGTPGYEVDLQLFRFNSDVYPAISQIGDYVKSHILDELFGLRRVLIGSASEYHYGHARFSRTHTLDIGSSGPRVKGRLLSILFASHSYYARAAHPNLNFKSFVFFIDPLFAITSLDMIFKDADIAFAKIQEEVRRQLLEVRLGDDDVEGLDEEWIKRGTENWADFSVFTFGEEGVEISFSPYTVAAYACGPQFVEIKYALLEEYISPIYLSALELSWF